MSNNILHTPVDTLLEIVKERKKISLRELSKQIQSNKNVVENWVDILSEYHVLKVTYHGIEPYIELYQEEESHSKISNQNTQDDVKDIEEIKNIFIEKSKKQGISKGAMKELWPVFVREYEEDLKKKFIERAKSYGIEDAKERELAWQHYKSELEKF